MFRNFQEIENQARKIGLRRVVALFPDNPDVMRAMADGKNQGLIEPIIVITDPGVNILLNAETKRKI